MEIPGKKYVIGIDLGTTNCAVSFADLAELKETSSAGGKSLEKRRLIKVFNVPQLTGHGEFTRTPVLPSFLYLPGEYDISKEGLKHPWKKRDDMFAGVFARDHGSKIPSRLVSSAKSWLCNPNADRRAKILPWGSVGIEKVSPVTATAEYLNHIKNAWNHFVKDEDSFIENQFVVITVPASFNEEARELTMEAVKAAGFGSSVTLLEEPLAAFYSWLILHESDWQKQVKAEDLILVCDVGGGTTDFSLISLKETQGTPRFERIAVGDHLILGGDNIDLALAQIVESKFRNKTKLDPDKWKTLCHRCREAKENILEQGSQAVRITIKGEGRSLIAGTLAADLTKEDVENVLRSKFYPEVDSHALNRLDTGKETAEFGLPFEKESAVTKHIIHFLEKHREDVKEYLNKEPLPDFILFNGGTLKPVIVQERIIRAIQKWFKKTSAGTPRVLENDSPDLAVGLGASYYGLVKQGEGVKVGSGSPRSYYIGVSVEKKEFPKALCLVERGLDEGSKIDLPEQQYDVRTNEPVSFDLYSSSFRSGDKAGKMIDIDDSLSAMTPVKTVIKFGKKSDKKMIPVSVGAEYTEMGTLSIFCYSKVSEHKWQLQFQLREPAAVQVVDDTEIYEASLIEEAKAKVTEVFESKDNNDQNLERIAKHLEKIVGQKKASWPLSFLRSIADTLINLGECRKISQAHEARWLNLTGYCMRPGLGDALDEERMKKLWRIYLGGSLFEKSKQNKLEWWIFIRRIAAGMNAGQQRQFFQDVSSVLTKKQKTKLPPQEQSELIMALGNMERLLVKDKIVLAKSLWPMLTSGKKQNDIVWALARLGARELLYGSADRVLPAGEISKWINRILKKPWTKNDPVESLLAQISRKTGDRTRDLGNEMRNKVVEWLKNRGADQQFIKMVDEQTTVDIKEQNRQFGEKLPSGLILKK